MRSCTSWPCTPATARHVSRKLAQRFVGDTPPAALVERMAQAYVQSGGRLSPALWVMLASPAFADNLLKQRMFRLPQDYVLATARAVCQDAPITHAEPLLNMLQAMGQAPFLRLTPDGYPQNAGEWQTALGMALRVQLAQALAQRQWRLTGPADAAQACNWDAAAAERSLGPWTAATRAAAEGLPPAQQAILLLSSPPRCGVDATSSPGGCASGSPTLARRAARTGYARRVAVDGARGWRSVVAGGEHARIEHQLQAVLRNAVTHALADPPHAAFF